MQQHYRGYGRRSDDDQSAWSPEAQERAARTRCDERGGLWCGWYLDDDISGTREDRPAFQQLLKDAAADPDSIVVVHKFDRIARDTETLLRVVYKVLWTKRVRVESVAEAIDPYTPLGKMMLTLSGGVSTYHVDNLRTEVQKGFREKAERGGWIGLPPMGYQSDWEIDGRGERIPKTHRIVPSDDAPLVREIFALYTTGNHSFLTIAQHLNSRGLTFPHPRTHERLPFNADVIRGVLKRRGYIGKVSCSGVEYEGAHEPLIDMATWDAVQALLKRRGRGQTGPSPAQSRTVRLLTEITFCGACGAPMHAQVCGSATGRRAYFHCRAHRMFGSEHCADGMTRLDILDEQILAIVRQFSIAAPLAQAVLVQAQQRPKKSRTDASARTREQLRRLRNAYLAGDPELTDAVYTRRKIALEQTLREQEPQADAQIDPIKAAEVLSSMASVLDVATPEEQRAIVHHLIDAVWARPHEIIAIRTRPAWQALYTACNVGDTISAGLEPTTFSSGG